MSESLPRRVLWYGSERPLPEKVQLRAGPASLVFEAGDLRYIRAGETELLRRIYVAVRDRNWGTIPAELRDLKIDKREDSFRITFESLHKQAEIDFRWKGTVTGSASGEVLFELDGKAHSTFLRNRIGICVHHPLAGCTGGKCRIEGADGTVTEGVFPYYVSPHQPFLDFRAVTHEPEPGLRAEVRFTGDLFEMEDHRNWSDAGFKTYSTPLRLPYPVEVREGTPIKQSVRLKVTGRTPGGGEARGRRVVTVAAAPKSAVALPAIGLGMPSHGKRLGAAEAEWLKALRPAHLRVDLDLAGKWETALEGAAADAAALRVPLEAAIFVSADAQKELDALAPRLAALKTAVKRWMVFHKAEKSTRAEWVRLARKILKPYAPQAAVMGGTNAYFAELNRGRPEDASEGVCYPLNPQVHAVDNDSMAENVEAQSHMIDSAKMFAANAGIVVSPVTLKPRFNPDATAAEAPAAGLPAQVDPRQMSLFGAAWTLGSLKHLAEGGASSVTYYETTGWLGVMETREGSRQPELFRSIPGAVFPLFHVLADATDFAGGEAAPTVSDEPLRVVSLLLQRGGRTRLLVANLNPEEQTVLIAKDLAAPFARVTILDESNAERAMREPMKFREQKGEKVTKTPAGIELRLRPYAVARLDLESGGNPGA